jgi:FimV-like protein
VSGLRQHLQASRDTLISLNQSNSDLESRVQSLDDISAKTGKLLSMKDATIAELQRKLATVQSGTVVAASGTNAGKPVASTMPAGKPAAQPVRAAGTPWYLRPLTWVIAVLVVLALAVLSLFGRRRAASGDRTRGPLPDPDDVSPHAERAGGPQMQASVGDGEESTHPQPAEAATRTEEDPYGFAALRQPKGGAAAAPLPLAEAAHAASVPPATSEPPHATAGGDAYIDDPVDTKLDLARAYLDMGDPIGARAMLEEVLEEGTQMQKDEAKRLLADAAG